MQKWLLTAALALLGSALAAGIQDAQATLDKGDWKAAADSALAAGGSDGYTLAAKATTLGASLAGSGQAEMLEKAQGYAKKAIELNANSADAYFELARADGRLAQYRGVLQSLNLAGEVKTSLDKAVKLDPKMAGAYVALGLWNAELAAKGFIATAATGASAAQVAPNFEKAIALEPNVVTHRLEYANALLKLSGRRTNYKPQAIAQLQQGVNFAPRNFWEQRDLDSAKKLLGSLR